MQLSKYSWRDVTLDTQKIIAETVGSFILGIVISLTADSAGAPCGSPATLAVGFTYVFLIYAFGHVSAAGLFNPAVTLGSFLSGHLTLALAGAFVVAQSGGALVGALLGNALRTAEVQSCNPTDLSRAFAVEAIYTGVLILVAQNCVLSKHANEPNSFYGLAVGLTVAAGMGVVSPTSGGFFNPALSLASDFASLKVDSTTLNDIWLYWLAPIIGAIFATAFQVFQNKVDKNTVAFPAWAVRCLCCCCRERNSNYDDGGGGGGGYVNTGDSTTTHIDDGRLPVAVPLTEFVGTFFLTLTAALPGRSETPGLETGFILAALTYACDHHGADFNPAVTLGLALRLGRVVADRGKIALIFCAQFAGAFAGALVALIIYGNVGYPSPDGYRGDGGAVVFEAIWTSILVYVVCSVMTKTTAESDETIEYSSRGHTRSYHGIAIGFAVFAGIQCSGPGGSGSGGVFNPAIGLGITLLVCIA